MGKGKNNLKRVMILTMATTVVILAGCSKEPEVLPMESGDAVVVNNGQETDTANQVNGDEVSEESEESVPKREVHQDKVPKTTRETLTWRDDLSGETSTQSDNRVGNAPDLSQKYIAVNDGNAEALDFEIVYTLYYQDEHNRAVGGEGVIQKSTVTQKPHMEDGGEDKLYTLPLLHTDLFKDERGMEDRNHVKVTKQAYNLITELNQNIYDTIESTQGDNHVTVSIGALYTEDNTIPYGVHYQAKSVHGDINFNYIINNIQEGLTVNYAEGTLVSGGMNE